MDYAITFALLLYINVFYFGLYATVEFFLLVFKCYKVTTIWLDMKVRLSNFLFWQMSSSSVSTIIWDMFLLAALVGVETFRLFIGQSHEPADFDRQLQKLFWILGLTVPSVYLTTYFTFWQTYVTRLDAALGIVFLLIQSMQLMSAMLYLWPRFQNPFRRTSEPHPYARLWISIVCCDLLL